MIIIVYDMTVAIIIVTIIIIINIIYIIVIIMYSIIFSVDILSYFHMKEENSNVL